MKKSEEHHGQTKRAHDGDADTSRFTKTATPASTLTITTTRTGAIFQPNVRCGMVQVKNYRRECCCDDSRTLSLLLLMLIIKMLLLLLKRLVLLLLKRLEVCASVELSQIEQNNADG